MFQRERERERCREREQAIASEQVVVPIYRTCTMFHLVHTTYIYLRLELKRSNGDCLREVRRGGCSADSSG